MVLFGRRATPSDQAAISSLISSGGGIGKYRNRFGAFHLASLLELGYLPIVAIGEDGIQCAVVFSDRPRRDSSTDEDARTTLWISLSVSREDSRLSFETCLRTAFEILPDVERVVVESSTLPSECGARLFKETDSTFRCERAAVVPTLGTREAKVEDTDDLVPLFEQKQSSESCACFNVEDTALADMIESQNQANRALVATYEERAVGLVAVSIDIDLTALQSCFELEPYPDISESQSGSTSEDQDDIAAAHPNNHGAFAMTLFCLDNKFKSRASDFFPAMFALFPDRNYCVLTAPPDMRSDSHLLRKFTSVPSKPGSTFTHSLFLLHRDSLLAPKHLIVTHFDKSQHAVSTLCEAGLQTALERCSSGEDEDIEEAVFAAVVNDKVVGIVVLDSRSASTNELNLLKNCYDVESSIPFERHRARSQAFVSHCLVQPAYSRHTRFIIKECMQLFDKTVLYHRASDVDSISRTILEEFVPVKCRHDSKRNEALHFFSRRFSCDTKRQICSRIVVVGATSCAVGFLNTLVFGDETVDFPNITLLGIFEGQQRIGPVDVDSTTFFPLSLASRIRTISAAVKHIDRENRVVVLSDGALMPYDILVLTNGLEESTRKRLSRRDAPVDILSHALERVDEMSRTTFTNVADKVPMASPPPHPYDSPFIEEENKGIKGLLSLSSPNVLERIKKDQTILIYGGTLLALSAIESLLKSGNTSSLLKLAVPEKSLDSLGDAVVDRMVMSSLNSCGLAEIKFGRKLRSLRYDGNKVVGAWFDDNTAIECDVVLGADAEDTPRDIFQALNDAGLVYDGRLVVGANFETSDAAIYAAGRNTKFSLSSLSGRSNSVEYHDEVNEFEIGGFLANSVFRKLLARENQEQEAIPPSFLKPRTISAILPGGLHYCRSKLPVVSPDAKSLPTGSLQEYTAPEDFENVAARNGVRSLKELSTTRDRYSILKIDGHGLLSDFVYVGRDPIAVEPQLFARIIGLQESWLNSAWTRYDRGEVDDWVDYFAQDWVSAIHFDRFDDLRKQVSEILLCDDASRQLVASLLKELKNNHVGTKSDRAALRRFRTELIGLGGCKLSPATRILVENTVLGYLRKNRALLPRFHIPEHHKH